MVLLETGNSAKLYCLNWIERRIQQQSNPIRILDLGCGTASHFDILLKRYLDVRYVGIEPSEAACAVARTNLQGCNAEIIAGYAYDIMGRLVHDTFDIIVSFSVMEHVYRRQQYLNTVASCMNADSYFLINYDAGHFVHPPNLKEHAKNIIGPLLARVGIERYYQLFVRELDFRQMVTQAGMTIEEAKSFNTSMKGIQKIVPSEFAEAHAQRWLDYELWLNEVGTPYDDNKAKLWSTRNFIIKKS